MLRRSIWPTPLTVEDTELLEGLLHQESNGATPDMALDDLALTAELGDEREVETAMFDMATLSEPEAPLISDETPFALDDAEPASSAMLAVPTDVDGAEFVHEAPIPDDEPAAADMDDIDHQASDHEALPVDQTSFDAPVVELDETAKSLIDLLALEATQLATALEEALAISEPDEWTALLGEQAEEIERLGEGASSIGLHGFQQVCDHIRDNLLILASQEPPCSEDQRLVLSGWSQPVMGYLQDLQNPGIQIALAQYVQDERWPLPVSPADGTAIQEALGIIEIDTGEDHVEPRQRHATLDDISLLLPEDVNPELLDSLLQEMPRQAADFSAAIQRLNSDEGNLEDVDAAQRVAHTLKGAANTVGVPGVANLTHHLEDILLALAQHNTLPTSALHHTLTNAADCLEAMSDTLIGMSDPPAEHDVLGVLQAVLDWANLIDRDGIPGDNTGAGRTGDVARTGESGQIQRC